MNISKQECYIEVILKKDLTRYHKSLKVGVKGIVLGNEGEWSRNYSRFVTIKFPKITLDILWDNLEIKENKENKEIKDVCSMTEKSMLDM